MTNEFHDNVTSRRTTIICSQCHNCAEVTNYHHETTGLSCAIRVPIGWQFYEPLGTAGLFMALCPEHAVTLPHGYQR
jgi:hypothetical protein